MSRSGASFSPNRVHRYHLWRRFDYGVGRVAFVGLNPSTADERENDPTVRRCIGFAQAWGFAYLDMLNIFALRSTNPRALRDAVDPVGPDNDAWLWRIANEVDLVVAAWGVHGKLNARGFRVRGLFEVGGDVQLHHLGLTKDGHPRHPLHLPADTRPEPWR